MAHRIERDWITEAGLRAICTVILHHDSEAQSHRCGYVCLPKGHPLYGKGYGESCECLAEAVERLKNTPTCEMAHLLSFSRMIAMLCGKVEPRPDVVFSVHGGITYSSDNPGGDYPVTTEDGWWYGFDCQHSGDGLIERSPLYDSGVCFTGEVRSRDYVVNECESLAAQLVEFIN
jgi:hypothetical protein